MSSNKKRRELNRAIEEHDRVKLSAQFAVGNHSMLNIAESILAKENAALKEQVAQLELIKDEHDKRGIDIDILVQSLNSAEAKLTALQSKSAAPKDARLSIPKS